MSLGRSYSRKLRDIFECRFLEKTFYFGMKKKILSK
jgi:hypothetical protein